MSAPAITALILAGGRGSRMGGVDKGLQLFNGTPLVQHTLQRVARQTLVPAQMMISANRHLDDYRALGVPVWPDSTGDAEPDFAGPLAGFLTGLTHCSTPLLLTLPCDVPLFSLSLCERLAHALQAQAADIAMVSAPSDTGELVPQPTFCLLRAQLRPSLADYLTSGDRRVGAWAARHRRVLVPFDQPGDARAFANANTLAQLRALEEQEPPP